MLVLTFSTILIFVPSKNLDASILITHSSLHLLKLPDWTIANSIALYSGEDEHNVYNMRKIEQIIKHHRDLIQKRVKFPYPSRGMYSLLHTILYFYS